MSSMMARSAAAEVSDVDPGETEARKASLVVLSPSGEVTCAVGLGNQSAVLALVRDPEWVAGIKTSRLVAMTINGRKLILMWTELADGAMVTVSEAPGDTVLEFIHSVDFAYDIFEHLLSNPFDAMTVVDTDAIVRFISPIHENFFRQRHGEGYGRPVQKMIENTRLHNVVQTGKAEVGHIQRMNGSNRVVSRTPIYRGEKIVGAIGRIMFKGPEQLEKLNQEINSLQSEVKFYRREAEAMRRNEYGLDSIIGESRAVRELKSDITRIAPLDVPVLVCGESGSGKELVAQALHRISSRRNNNMIMINAAALPSTLVESELFGYSAGAFTGAHQKGHPGKFEQANSGSLFLDEIGDMPLEVQAKLLRVLQDGYVEKLGSTKAMKVDFRLISATNRDLEGMIRENEFRLDLFYRISPVVLHVPPLRDRLEDIPALAEEFLRNFAERHDRPVCSLTPEVTSLLQSHNWPGNVRQLKHEVERAAIFSNGGEIDLDLLRRSLYGVGITAVADRSTTRGAEAGDMQLKDHMQKVEDVVIESAMQRLQGNKKRVAEELGISRSYLYKKLAEIGTM
ncbi:Transcriptional regulator containing PAS, AAA-type ATPase, and DNA-binding Fis domains [Sphingobium sp. AP50]|uniref:sigma-54 interaction domain-containing protein n=1 Tax=Sphingobium sp. AP50 TaxID=1884369 RepID=UPI0008CE13A2|nr:sigma 54-interacting transcriptional regulator [Sphingobium sp. AP50]SEK05649.1 Transcriptional regulator containing PAS, AAA-type ATPase, and DNA-binding Fis domains [Sphingobium sp. AP50]